MDKRIKEYAEEAVGIIKEVIIDNELVNGSYINYVGSNECGDTVIIRDILNYEIQYSLSEVSYVFTDYLDCIGDENKNVYKTVLNSKNSDDYDKNKNLFMESLLRLKKIEQAV